MVSLSALFVNEKGVLIKVSMDLSLVDMLVSVGNHSFLDNLSKIMRLLSFQYLNRQSIYAITNNRLSFTTLEG